MKKILIGFLSLLLTVAVTAKENEVKKESATDTPASVALVGSITDANSGESLVGVEVKIEGTDLKTYTDFDGTFTFNNVKPGEYKVVTNYISYKPATEKLEASAKCNELKLKLQPSN
ncbi:MAG: TonB-dependent [Prolixibacteraceae bacterium]|nr:MAG: TonB-dependent [Prolixibacteraceae bacterium]